MYALASLLSPLPGSYQGPNLTLLQILFVLTFLQLPESPNLTSGIPVLGAAQADCERQTCPTDNKAAFVIPILQAAEPRGGAWSKLIKARRITPRDLSKVIKEA